MSSGISCPYCACKMSTVRNTRPIKWRGREIIRRYRVCRHCKMSFTTTEEVVPEEPSPPKNQPPAGVPRNPFLT